MSKETIMRSNICKFSLTVPGKRKKKKGESPELVKGTLTINNPCYKDKKRKGKKKREGNRNQKHIEYHTSRDVEPTL